MFENITTTEKEKLTPEEIFANFEKKEKVIKKEGTDFLENLAPEKFKNKAANLLLAFSLFAGASSAFAGEQNIDKELPSMGEEQYSQTRDKGEVKNRIADFDWLKVATKIEISVGTTREEVKEFHPEAISFWKGSDFYSGFTILDANEVFYTVHDAVNLSHSASEFFANLSVLSQKGNSLSEKQEILMLQDFGYYLLKTYNQDMRESGEYVVVSDDKMFEALRNQVVGDGTLVSGMCGNIHTFLVKTAESLGIEAWLQGGTVMNNQTKGAHVWAGLAVGEGAEKQIAFLDYGTLIPTGTLNYKDALGIAERHHRAVAVLNTFVGNSTELLFPVKSRAQEVVSKSIGVEESEDRLGRNLESGEIKKEGRSLEIVINPEIKEIKLGSDSVGLAFFKFEDTQNNPYQSLKDLSAWRGRVGVSNENFGIEAGVTVLNMNIKELNGNTFSSDDIIVTLATDYIDKKQLTKNQYGEFALSWGATLGAAISKQLGGDESQKITGGQADATYGGRLVYLNPNNVGKFYIGASKVSRGALRDFQNQNLTAKSYAKNFIVGGSVEVTEGEVVNIEVAKSSLAWGESLDVKGGLSNGVLKGSVGYEKKSSDYERFIPSSEKVEISATYKGGPKWEMDVIGAKTKEKYKDAQAVDSTSAEVKLRIFLW